MWPISDAMATQLRQSHTVEIVAEVWTAGLTAQLLNGSQIYVTDGSVSVDRSASYRRSLTMKVVDQYGYLIPFSADPSSSPIAPYGNEVVVYRGVVFPDGTAEVVPLGVFPISEVEVEDTGASEITISGFDRSRRISRSRWTDPYVIASGTNYVTAIQAIATNRLPYSVTMISNTLNVSTTSGPTVYAEQDDPWQRMTELAQAIGCEVFFDAAGQLVIQDEPDPTIDTPVWDYIEGDNSMMLSLGHILSDEPGYNVAVVTGENSDNNNGTLVPRGVVYDDDPTSPTYYLGGYGQVPIFMNNPLVRTNAAATTAATTVLRRVLGLTETVKMAAIPNPAHEAGDAVRVIRDSDGIDMQVLLETFDVPLNVQNASGIVTRSRRTS